MTPFIVWLKIWPTFELAPHPSHEQGYHISPAGSPAIDLPNQNKVASTLFCDTVPDDCSLSLYSMIGSDKG
jgi:hypothetical protein